MIKQFVTQKACLECLGCCRFSESDSVWSPCILKEEINSLAKKGLPPALITLTQRIRLLPFEQEEIFFCSLFNPESNKCQIYSFRPFECQLYPFLVNRRGGTLFLAVDPACPFIENKLNTQEFENYVQYLTGFLITPRMRRMLKNNLSVFQAYTDVRDLCRLSL